MYILFIIIAIVSAIILIMAVLVQKSKKEGGLDPLASSTTQVMGITKTTDILEKITWSLAFIIAFSSIASTFYLKKNINDRLNFISPNVKIAKERSLLNSNTKKQNDSNKNIELQNKKSSKKK